MAIKYLYEPTGEQVTKEPWRWVAVYYDGDSLEQFEVKNGKAVFHRFAEINRDKLAYFLMVHDTRPTITLKFDPNTMKLVHFYRNQILHVPLHDGVHQAQEKVRIYYFGYEQDGVQHLTGILPDGRLILTNNPDYVHEG